jgi:hypothetical protein
MTACSPLGGDAEKDPAWFAAILGKLDAIAHLKRDAKETKEVEREKVKEVCIFLLRICYILTLP